MSLKFAGQIFLFCSLFAVAQAALNCPSNVASGSMYFTPNLKDYCKNGQICASFKDEVAQQGSGRLPGNKTLVSTGTLKHPNFKVISSKDCIRGSAGICLQPFISVAADPAYYSMGDIIDMPSMKGRVITLPDGKTMIHPGYFVVADIGYAIKGPNRFDFYTGASGMYDRKNPFGVHGIKDVRSVDKTECNKPFQVVRRDSQSLQYNQSMAAIDNALSNSPSRAVAQSSPGYNPSNTRGGNQ